MTTMTSWISHEPGRAVGTLACAERACPFWGLVERRQSGEANADILRDVTDLTADDLAVAWEYADAHADEIERALWANEACMVEHDGLPVPLEMLRAASKSGFERRGDLRRF